MQNQSKDPLTGEVVEPDSPVDLQEEVDRAIGVIL